MNMTWLNWLYMQTLHVPFFLYVYHTIDFKYSKKVTAISIIAMLASQNVISYFLMSHTQIKILINGTVFFGTLYLLSKKNIKRVIIDFLSFQVVVLACDQLTFMTMDYILQGYPQVEFRPSILNQTRLMGVVLCNIYVTASTIVVLVLRKKIQWEMKVWFSVMILLFFGVQHFYLVDMFANNFENQDEVLLTTGFVSGTAIMATTLAAYFLYLRILKVADEKREYELLAMKWQQENAYYHLAEEYAENARKIRHDIANQLQTAYLLLNSNNQKAQKVIDEIELSLGDIGNLYQTGNDIADAVLSLKTAQAKKHGISIELICDSLSGISVSDGDLCSIFTNLLDNAIEACQEMNENNKSILVKIGCKNENWIFYVENPWVAQDQNKLSYASTKGQDRGYGLKILKDITKKYHGEMQLEQKQEKFVAMIMVQA